PTRWGTPSPLRRPAPPSPGRRRRTPARRPARRRRPRRPPRRGRRTPPAAPAPAGPGTPGRSPLRPGAVQGPPRRRPARPPRRAAVRHRVHTRSGRSIAAFHSSVGSPASDATEDGPRSPWHWGPDRRWGRGYLRGGAGAVRHTTTGG